MKDATVAELMKKWAERYERREREAQMASPKLLEFCRAWEAMRAALQEAWFRPALNALADAHVALDALIGENAQMVADIQRRDEEAKAAEAQHAAVREQVNAELERLRSQVKELRDQAVTARMASRPVLRFTVDSGPEETDRLRVAREELRAALAEVAKERDELKSKLAETAKHYEQLANSWNAWQANLDAGASKRDLKEAGKRMDAEGAEGAQAFRLARALLRMAARAEKDETK